MGTIGTALSMSLDGFIAGPEGATAGLHDWLTAGQTPSRFSPSFTMAKPSAEFFDAGIAATGAVIAGRRTYDVSGAWAGRGGPVPGLPLVVLTHRVPERVPAEDPPYTFVTDGIEAAVEQARAMASPRNVHLMGASVVQQSIRAGLLDQLIINLVPRVLGEGVRLLDGLDPSDIELEVVRVIDAPGVTHLAYRVIK